MVGMGCGWGHRGFCGWGVYSGSLVSKDISSTDAVASMKPRPKPKPRPRPGPYGYGGAP